MKRFGLKKKLLYLAITVIPATGGKVYALKKTNHCYVYAEVFQVIMFKILSKIGKVVSLCERRWRHVLEHPEMENQLDRIKETVLNPDEVKESTHDPSALLFYKLYEETPLTEKYLLVVIKTLNGEGFIVTAFFTDRVKKGGAVWRKNL